MNKQVASLNGYVKSLKVTPKGEVSTEFQNWVPPLAGDLKIYRSAQPNYNGQADTLQLFSRAIIKWLAGDGRKIRLIVSLNHMKLAPKVSVWLQLEGIKFVHLKTEDFGVPELQKVKEACDVMASVLGDGNSVLVYCGFGQGRTGMMVTAYKVYDKFTHKKSVGLEALLQASTAETLGQEKLLRELAALMDNGA